MHALFSRVLSDPEARVSSECRVISSRLRFSLHGIGNEAGALISMAARKRTVKRAGQRRRTQTSIDTQPPTSLRARAQPDGRTVNTVLLLRFALRT